MFYEYDLALYNTPSSDSLTRKNLQRTAWLSEIPRITLTAAWRLIYLARVRRQWNGTAHHTVRFPESASEHIRYKAVCEIVGVKLFYCLWNLLNKYVFCLKAVLSLGLQMPRTSESAVLCSWWIGQWKLKLWVMVDWPLGSLDMAAWIRPAWDLEMSRHLRYKTIWSGSSARELHCSVLCADVECCC